MSSNSILKETSLTFLENYLNNASPTGYESSGQKLWMEYLKPYVDTFITDTYGTAVGIINPDAQYKVVIEGHADEVGPEDFNVLLSENRAKSVANAMIAKGIPQERVTTKAFGESKPKVPNTTPEGRSANRRVELKILF